MQASLADLQSKPQDLYKAKHANPYYELDRQQFRPKPKYPQLENPEIKEYYDKMNEESGLKEIFEKIESEKQTQ